MSLRRVDVFFYGLFMDVDVLRAKRLDPREPRQASVQGFALRIGRRATLVPDPEARVYGVLMRLSHEEIERLYSEPSVAVYRPEALLAEVADGARLPALCFTLPVPPPPGETNHDYAQKLRELGERLGLPASYVDRIT